MSSESDPETQQSPGRSTPAETETEASVSAADGSLLAELEAQQVCPDFSTDLESFDSTETLLHQPGHRRAATHPGQTAAASALEFGSSMRHAGYNMFVLGPNGTGKQHLVEHIVAGRAASDRVPSDWCYVHNFDDPERPLALELPPGRGRDYQRELRELVLDLHDAIRAAFEAEEYVLRRESLVSESKTEHEAALKELRNQAHVENLAIIRSPMGFAIAPLVDGEVMTPVAFQALAEDERNALQARLEAMETKLAAVMREEPRRERELRAAVRKLNQEIVRATVRPLIDELRDRHNDVPGVLTHLESIQDDIIDRVQLMASHESDEEAKARAEPIDPALYQANLIVDHADQKGAPVVFERHPVIPNLFGRVDRRQEMGVLITDFNLIRPGALHRANGGYLIIDARALLTQTSAFEHLERSLDSGQLLIEDLPQILGFRDSVTLHPEAIPLDVKVILLGERRLYYLLHELDPEFSRLFRVCVDLEDELEAGRSQLNEFAHLIADSVREHSLLPFTRDAVLRLMRQASRWAEDATKLSCHTASLIELMAEADHFARAQSARTVDLEHVRCALDQARVRNGRIERKTLENALRGIIDAPTDGAVVGSVNGLAVLEIGRSRFGRASRISARVRLGRGEVIDIEREVELGGPLHSKGVLILASYLGARYAADQPLALRASLVFEQSYGGVDGDSASSAEFYALISAIAQVPLRQDYAVTGSIDQFGHVQAIGGVNDKIEGFFELCARRGLTGHQGVLIPQSNVAHLVLDEKVVEAVQAGRFHIRPVSHVDQGLAILSSPPGSDVTKLEAEAIRGVHDKVQARVEALAKAASALSSRAGGDPATCTGGVACE